MLGKYFYLGVISIPLFYRSIWPKEEEEELNDDTREQVKTAVKNSWIWALLLITGAAAGIICFDRLGSVLLPMIWETMDAMSKNEAGEVHAPPILTATIFLNNLLVTAICFLTARITKGILPAVILLFNGLVIGIFAVWVSRYTSVGDFFLGIAPHGIIECMALFIACAIGMRGVSRVGWKAFSIPAALLLTAAGIEVYVTPLVMG